MEYEALIKDVYFFKELTDRDLQWISEFCHEQEISRGEILFEEGDTAEKFFIIITGLVEVWKDYHQPHRDLLALHGKGHLFGEMALIDDLPRSATVVARENSKVLFLYKNDFLRIIQENNTITVSIMKSISSMVRKSNDSFVDSLRDRNTKLEQALSDLQQTQNELLMSERLSTLGRFSSMILHDIRNPISVLRGYAEMIQMHSDRPEKIMGYAKNIIGEADNLNRLAGELLDYSRGEIRLNISIVKIEDLFNRVIERFKLRTNRKDIKIIKDIQFNDPVLMDMERMSRVLMNLSDNAKKAMPQTGGTILLSAKKQEELLIFSVEDDGLGMSSEVKEHIFKPFYSESKKGGTGLGLLIVKNVVEAHNGFLSVSSEEGKGTIFTIELPLRA